MQEKPSPLYPDMTNCPECQQFYEHMPWCQLGQHEKPPGPISSEASTETSPPIPPEFQDYVDKFMLSRQRTGMLSSLSGMPFSECLLTAMTMGLARTHGQLDTLITLLQKLTNASSAPAPSAPPPAENSKLSTPLDVSDAGSPAASPAQSSLVEEKTGSWMRNKLLKDWKISELMKLEEVVSSEINMQILKGSYLRRKISVTTDTDDYSTFPKDATEPKPTT
jgi:hypothetical protein